jgi:IS5 family transposase
MGRKEEAPMLRLNDDQPSLWESVLRPELFRMNEELATVDRLLDDERFLASFKERFYTRVGRPTIPVATYLRMMYLKRRYKMGYETLVKEVSDSFAWRRFCRISLEKNVPDDTTLIKLTHKYGDDTLRELNDAVVLKLKEEKVIRGKKLRIDTTVTEANIHYPTDTGLMADGVKVITRTVGKLKKLVGGVGKGFRNRTRKIKKICLTLNKVLRTRVSVDSPPLAKVKEELIRVADDVVAAAKEVRCELGAPNRPRRVRKLVEQLEGWLAATERVIDQTRRVLGGELHLRNRLVSIFDVKACPIRKGKLRVDTEFGRKVLLGETDHGIITTYKVLDGNPADTSLLKTAVRGHRRLFRRRLQAVAGDRGMYSWCNELWLKEGGVRQVSIPVRGRASAERLAEQRQFWFRRLQRFRAGAEGRISVLKRLFGLDRSWMRGDNGTEIWVGQGIFAHNLWQAARAIGN